MSIFEIPTEEGNRFDHFSLIIFEEKKNIKAEREKINPERKN